MIKKIVFTGAESTGKSFFARETAVGLAEPMVSEYAVYYLHTINRLYSFNDLEQILEGQLKWEDFFVQQANQFLICDTDPLVLYIWSMDKFGRVSDKIKNCLLNDSYDMRFLCFPDIPWINGVFREDETRRELLHEKYVEACKEFNLNYELLEGEKELKFKKIENVISENIKKLNKITIFNAT